MGLAEYLPGLVARGLQGRMAGQEIARQRQLEEQEIQRRIRQQALQEMILRSNVQQQTAQQRLRDTAAGRAAELHPLEIERIRAQIESTRALAGQRNEPEVHIPEWQREGYPSEAAYIAYRGRLARTTERPSAPEKAEKPPDRLKWIAGRARELTRQLGPFGSPPKFKSILEALPQAQQEYDQIFGVKPRGVYSGKTGASPWGKGVPSPTPTPVSRATLPEPDEDDPDFAELERQFQASLRRP